MVIAGHLIKDFPELYPMFAEKEFTYNNIRQINRNPLLYKSIGADGLKTGKTDAGGYGLVASAVQGNQRLIMVVNGLGTIGERARESESLLLWGFRNFRTLQLFKAHEVVDRIPLWLGRKPMVDITVPYNVNYTLPREQLRHLKVEVRYLAPVPTPVKAGQAVGHLIISAPKLKTVTFPLLIAEDVEQADFFTRIRAAAHYLFWGHNDERV
jgi:D-alanyl-D-alanine carboxypeptidase (penicillin-binding protein 5/6)